MYWNTAQHYAKESFKMCVGMHNESWGTHWAAFSCSVIRSSKSLTRSGIDADGILYSGLPKHKLAISTTAEVGILGRLGDTSREEVA